MRGEERRKKAFPTFFCTPKLYQKDPLISLFSYCLEQQADNLGPIAYVHSLTFARNIQGPISMLAVTQPQPHNPLGDRGTL